MRITAKDAREAVMSKPMRDKLPPNHVYEEIRIAALLGREHVMVSGLNKDSAQALRDDGFEVEFILPKGNPLTRPYKISWA